jgi:hypothetical protein
LTRSRSAGRRGGQAPRYELIPTARSTAGAEAVDLAASAGLILEPAQERVLKGSLGELPDGRWAAFEVALIEPRQNGKGAVITARELAGLYLFGEELQTHTAHRFDTCLEGFRRIRDYIEGSPDLSRRVHKVTEAHGQESIELFNPTQRLLFKARSKGSGRGFSGDVVYLDEAFWLMDLGAMLPTMSARPNPQLWYLSSAPLPRVESDILRNLCRRGRAGAMGQTKPRRLAYFEWSAAMPETADRDEWEKALAEIIDDRAAWAEANPGIGYRITEEFVQSERDAMSVEDFARERLGVYPEIPDVADEPALDPADWKRCEDLRSKVLDPVTFVFEVSVDRRWAVIASAGASSAGGTHVELIENRRNTGWVVDRLVQLRDRHRPAAILCNPAGPAGGLLPECERKGLVIGVPDPAKAGKVRPVTARDYVQACAAAYDAVAQYRWRHMGQPALNMAAAAAVKRTVGDAWVFDRESSTDISPLLAVTGRDPEGIRFHPHLNGGRFLFLSLCWCSARPWLSPASPCCRCRRRS